jgi:hypothetical protein
LSLHGLRKAAATRLASAGCTHHEIKAITGHKTLSEIERYTREAEKAQLAVSGMGRKVVAMLGKKEHAEQGLFSPWQVRYGSDGKGSGIHFLSNYLILLVLRDGFGSMSR